MVFGWKDDVVLTVAKFSNAMDVEQEILGEAGAKLSANWQKNWSLRTYTRMPGFRSMPIWQISKRSMCFFTKNRFTNQAVVELSGDIAPVCASIHHGYPAQLKCHDRGPKFDRHCERLRGDGQ